MSDQPGSLAGMLSGYDLMPLLEPTAVPFENFVPEVTRTLRDPADLITTWQHYDNEALEDVRFEAVGPAIDVRNIAYLLPLLTLPTARFVWMNLRRRARCLMRSR
jgi:hypothetical protein